MRRGPSISHGTFDARPDAESRGSMSNLDFIPVSLATFVPNMDAGLDLYRQDDTTSKFVLFRGHDYPLGEEELERLRGRGVTRLYIAKSARERYQEYLRQISESDGDETPIRARVEAMNEVVRDVLRASFASKDTDETVAAVAKLGAMTSEIVSHDEFAADDLFRVMHHDYATFTHVANVSLYAAVLANELGYADNELEQITVGGLLHDLGKLEVSDKILCKPGRLDDDEFGTIKTHPTVGFRKLAGRGDLNLGQLMMVYQHHERPDGQGYPVGVTEDDIHPWAKICSVVDVFEALTSQRPYRKPMSRRQALELQSNDVGTAFDPEIFQCWDSIIRRDFGN